MSVGTPNRFEPSFSNSLPKFSLRKSRKESLWPCKRCVGRCSCSAEELTGKLPGQPTCTPLGKRHTESAFCCFLWSLIKNRTKGSALADGLHAHIVWKQHKALFLPWLCAITSSDFHKHFGLMIPTCFSKVARGARNRGLRAGDLRTLILPGGKKKATRRALWYHLFLTRWGFAKAFRFVCLRAGARSAPTRQGSAWL